MLKKLKIRNKILIPILGINFLILATIFLLYYNFSKDIIIKETQEKALVKVQELNKSLNGFLDSKAKVGWTLCNSPWVKEWLTTNEIRFVRPGEDIKFDNIKKFMYDLKKKDGEIESVFIASDKTEMYYDDKDYRVDDSYRVTTRAWYQNAKALGKPSFDFDADFTSGKIFVNYRNPIYDDNGKFLGNGGVDISLEFLGEFLKQVGVFKTGEVSLIGNDGTILFNQDTTLILKKKLSDYKDGDNYKNIELVAQKIINGENGFENVVYEGKDKFFLFTKMDNINWTILLSVDSEEINAPLTSLAQTSIIILFISLIALLIAISLLANSISKPLINFANGISKISELGSSDFNIEVKSQDEIGELSKSFKDMLLRIKSKELAAEQISQGNLNINVDIISDQDTLGRSMQRMKDRISSLIHEIEIIADASQQGNLSLRIDSSKYQGEYKKILDGINKTIDTLLQPVNEATITLEKVAARDLTVRMSGDYKGDNDKLKRFLNSAITNLEIALQQVSNTVESHSEAAFQISQLTEDIAINIEKQTFQTTEVSTSVEEMTSTILETSKNAHIMAETADQSKKSALQGGDVVTQTINGMKNIALKVNKSAEVVQALGKSSEEIGEIIAVIDDIADQTNLLALNAAIEAARAGEQGRGFAVVADEVRKLAERTTKATKEIADMIKKIQSDTIDAVKAMEEGQEEVTIGINLADKAGKALKEIVDISIEVTERVVQIATANEEQSSVSEQISHNIETINSLSQQTASGMQLISQHVEDFKDLTAHLKKLNSNFKISNNTNQKYLN